MSAKKARKIPGKIPESGAAGELTFGIRSAGVRRRANPGGFEAAAGGREPGVEAPPQGFPLFLRVGGFEAEERVPRRREGFRVSFLSVRTSEARDREPAPVAPVAAFTLG